jgi:hypothetical protein
VLPDQVAVPGSGEAFTAEGALVDPKRQGAVTALGKGLASFLQKLKA